MTIQAQAGHSGTLQCAPVDKSCETLRFVWKAESAPHKPKKLLSCCPHDPQVSPHPCLDVTGAPYSPHGVQILVAAGEYHTHSLVTFPDLGHGFLVHELSLALVFHSLKVQTPMEQQYQTRLALKYRSFLWPRWELILVYRGRGNTDFLADCFYKHFEMKTLNLFQFQLLLFCLFYCVNHKHVWSFGKNSQNWKKLIKSKLSKPVCFDEEFFHANPVFLCEMLIWKQQVLFQSINLAQFIRLSIWFPPTPCCNLPLLTFGVWDHEDALVLIPFLWQGIPSWVRPRGVWDARGKDSWNSYVRVTADTNFLNESLPNVWNCSASLSHALLSALITHSSWARIDTAGFASACCQLQGGLALATWRC